MSKQFSPTLMRVAKVTSPKSKTQYQVFERLTGDGWIKASKAYDHSTSAFAAMGRLYQKQVLNFLKEQQ